MNHTVPNSAANSSAPSVGASSVVTDANSALSGGSHLQRSASFNTESYPRLPASPMSFSSNISGSSVMDGSSIVQQSSHQDQLHTHGASTATSQPTLQESGNMLQVLKKPRVTTRQEERLPQQVIQQLLQRQGMLQLQGQMNPQLETLIQQQRLLQQRQQQQQILQSLPPFQQAHMQQQQLRQQLQQQMMQASHPKCPFDSGICARRLMQYFYHQRHHPPDNNILYWRNFFSEYFAPHAKKRWCLSLYDNVSNHTLGVFQRASMDAWHCNICGSRSGKGFEASFEVLPRLNKIKFDSGVLDEFLYLDMPHEYRLSSGIMLLEYGKATLECVYEHLRVVREGQLRIVFSPDLKILSWDFCTRRHEELLPRRLVAPQVNQLLQVAQKYQNAVTESGSAGVSSEDLQTNLHMFMMTGRQLARNLELPFLNDLGFSKRYVRCLQISEVVNCMKDLIDFSWDHRMGPIESLKCYPHRAATKLLNQDMQEVEQPVKVQTADQNSLAKIMGMHSGVSNHVNTVNSETGIQVLNTSAQGATVLGNYHSLLRQNTMNSSSNSLQSNMSTITGPNQSQSAVSPQGHASICGPGPSIHGSLRNAFFNCLPGPHQQPTQQAVNGIPPQQNDVRPTQVNQPLQQQRVIQQLLQEMMNNNRGILQHSANVPTANGNMSEEVFGGGITSSGVLPARAPTGSVGNISGGDGAALQNATAMNLSRNNSFKSMPSNQNPTASSSSNVKPDPLDNFNLPDLVQEISLEFADDGLFNGESSDNVYDWKS